MQDAHEPGTAQRDPWVVAWFADNDFGFDAAAHHQLARGDIQMPIDREIAHVTDDEAMGIPIRVYRDDPSPTGLIVYFHGGGFCIGSIGIMDNVARELAHATGAVVVSVEYRLAPEHPYPAGLDDCIAVTRWAIEGSMRYGVPANRVMVAGESAGGNLATATAMRMRDEGGPSLAGQILVYPVVDTNDSDHESRRAFIDFGMTKANSDFFWESYSGGRDLTDEPWAVPLHADDLTGLPPAHVVLGGCDYLRDEGQLYVARLRDAGIDVHDVSVPGQPHGFVNHGFPAAAPVLADIGIWVRERLAD